jgi:hypothetical protein
MANLTSSQIKDSYQSVLTTSETTSDPTTGTLQNGKGSAITALTTGALTLTGDLTVDTSTLKVDSANNRVGIGTASPGAPLHVAFGSAVNDAEFRLQQTTNGTAAQITLAANNDGGAIFNFLRSTTTSGTEHWRIDSGGTVGTMAFKTNGAVERMRIDASGNVGIGSTDTSIARLLVNRLNATQDQPVFAWTDAQDNTGYMAIRSATETGESTGGASLFADGGLHFGRLVTGAFSERMRITSDASAYLRLASGTAGIQFNGDTAASNALDDYEEGTFDFGIAFGGGSTGITYTSRQGAYTKIGNKVTVTGQILLSNKGSDTGSATITGLPFTIPNNANRYPGAAIGFISNITFADQMTAYGNANSTSIQLAETTTAGTHTNLTDADFSNTSSVIISMTYLV